MGEHGYGSLHRVSLILAVGAFASLCAAPSAFSSASTDPPARDSAALRLGIVEEESVQLILLDVVVRDDEGRPMRGLTKKDFDLKLDWKRWPIYSVDDLCEPDAVPGEGPGESRPEGAPEGAQAPRGGEVVAGAEGAAASPEAPGDDRVRYVLYFDFSQLRLASRRQAIDAAIRWVAEAKQPGDEAMIEAYVEKTGLRTLVPFTRDASRLRAALDAARDDKSLVDGFPDQFQNRVDECGQCIVQALCNDCLACICEPNAIAEYQHGKRALDALGRFMQELQMEPGRKAVIFMHENTLLSPGEFYFVPRPEFRIGEHGRLLESIAAEATSAKAALYTAHFGDNLLSLGAAQAIEAGYELANYTGGAFSRASYVSFDVMKGAGRERSCTYRIAFEPPGESRGEVHDVVVSAAGRRLPSDYRVKEVTDADLLMRRARKALRDPDREREIAVSAALVPRAGESARWGATVQVSIDAATLGLLPSAGSEAGHLDVGALLVNERTGKTWELMAGSEIRRSESTNADAVLLYEAALDRLPPGPYVLRAFAHDKAADLHGASHAEVDLPKSDGFVGPLAARPRKAVYVAEMPLKGGPGKAGGRLLQARETTSPYSGEALARGDSLSLDSWICSDVEITPGVNLVRFVEREGQPLFRMADGELHVEGRCVRFTDLLDTIELDPGEYTYRILWIRSGEERPVSRTLAFSVKADPKWLACGGGR